jgi:hypothetical protein
MALRDNERLMYLLERLDRIQFASTTEELEIEMHEFTRELLQLKPSPQNHNMGQTTDLQFPTPSGQRSVFMQGDETILVSFTTTLISFHHQARAFCHSLTNLHVQDRLGIERSHHDLAPNHSSMPRLHIHVWRER